MNLLATTDPRMIGTKPYFGVLMFIRWRANSTTHREISASALGAWSNQALTAPLPRDMVCF